MNRRPLPVILPRVINLGFDILLLSSLGVSAILRHSFTVTFGFLVILLLIIPKILSAYHSHTASTLPANSLGQSLLNSLNLNNLLIHPYPQPDNFYSPKTRQILLHEPTYHSSSSSAIATLLHEIGHALQHHQHKLISQPLATANNIASRIMTLSRISLALIILLPLKPLITPLLILFSLSTLILAYNLFTEFHASYLGFRLCPQSPNIPTPSLIKKPITLIPLSYLITFILDLPALFFTLYLFLSR